MVSFCNSHAAVRGAITAVVIVVAAACSDTGAPTTVTGSSATVTTVTTTESTIATTTVTTIATTTATTTESSAQVSAETSLEVDGAFRWLWLEPGTVNLVWRDDADIALGQLENARQLVEADGRTVVAVANAGIYDESLRPLGLHIEDRVELNPLNLRSGFGNFYLQPNGVFAVTEAGFAVVSTGEFTAAYRGGSLNGGDPVVHATQSGPLLVVDGEINPLFTPESTSLKTRTAVGVDSSGRAALIQARLPVTMWALADHGQGLGLVNLLYLDGSVARLDLVTAERPVFPNVALGAMIVVTEKPDNGPG